MEGYQAERDRLLQLLQEARATVKRLEDDLVAVHEKMERERTHQVALSAWRPAKRGARDVQNIPAPRRDPREDAIRSLETKLMRRVEPGLQVIPEKIADAKERYEKDVAELTRIIRETTDPDNAARWSRELEMIKQDYPRTLESIERERQEYLEERNEILTEIVELKHQMGIETKIQSFYV
jgi:hypothetical protein